MNNKIFENDLLYNILVNVRSDFSSKILFESSMKNTRGYASQSPDFRKEWEEICHFVYKTDLDNNEILKAYYKYGSYDQFIKSKNKFNRFFIERINYPSLKNQNNKIIKRKAEKQKMKKYTTYSARGHFHSNNSISAFLNYFAMLPAYLLLMFIGGIAKIFVSISDLVKPNKENKINK